jgi:hypothetical protein
MKHFVTVEQLEQFLLNLLLYFRAQRMDITENLASSRFFFLLKDDVGSFVKRGELISDVQYDKCIYKPFKYDLIRMVWKPFTSSLQCK